MTPPPASRGALVVFVALAACLAIAAAAIAMAGGDHSATKVRAGAASAHTTTTRVARSTTTSTARAPRTTTTAAAATTTTRASTAPTHPPTTTAATAPPTRATTPPPIVAVGGTNGLGAVAGKTIVVDPGHNGLNYAHPEINNPVNIGTETRACDTTGTETNGGYTEAAYTFDVSMRLAAILRSAGANVVLTRTSNSGWGPCINERAAIGNRAHAAVAISIHADGGPAGGRGFHVLYPASIPGLTAPIAPDSYRLALDVRAAYAASSGMPYSTYVGGGTALMARSDLGGLNLSTVPKVFIETGNMRNATDAALLVDANFRQRAAAAIANGLAAYLAGR